MTKYDLIVCYFLTEPRPETKVLLGECIYVSEICHVIIKV